MFYLIMCLSALLLMKFESIFIRYFLSQRYPDFFFDVVNADVALGLNLDCTNLANLYFFDWL